MKTSPAPWSAEDPGDEHQTLVIVSRSGTDDAEDIAEVSLQRSDIHPNQRANARLIAAAPELLAACEALVKLLHADSTTGGGHAVADARAAIARAKGTS